MDLVNREEQSNGNTVALRLASDLSAQRRGNLSLMSTKDMIENILVVGQELSVSAVQEAQEISCNCQAKVAKIFNIYHTKASTVCAQIKQLNRLRDVIAETNTELSRHLQKRVQLLIQLQYETDQHNTIIALNESADALLAQETIKLNNLEKLKNLDEKMHRTMEEEIILAEERLVDLEVQEQEINQKIQEIDLTIATNEECIKTLQQDIQEKVIIIKESTQNVALQIEKLRQDKAQMTEEVGNLLENLPEEMLVPSNQTIQAIVDVSVKTALEYKQYLELEAGPSSEQQLVEQEKVLAFERQVSLLGNSLSTLRGIVGENNPWKQVAQIGTEFTPHLLPASQTSSSFLADPFSVFFRKILV